MAYQAGRIEEARRLDEIAERVRYTRLSLAAGATAMEDRSYLYHLLREREAEIATLRRALAMMRKVMHNSWSAPNVRDTLDALARDALGEEGIRLTPSGLAEIALDER